MFDEFFTIPVTLRNPVDSAADGSSAWEEFPAMAAVREFSSLDVREYGRIDNGLIFTLKSPAAPRRGCRICWHGRDYQVRSIRACRNLDQLVIAYRCVVFGS